MSSDQMAYCDVFESSQVGLPSGSWSMKSERLVQRRVQT